jgi:membrane protein YqaA with SNARE-associated domain
MSLIEKYLFLLVDTFYGNFALSANEEMAIWVMNDFKETSDVVWLITFLGVILAALTNYLMGVITNNIFIRYATEANTIRYENIKKIWAKYHFVMLLLCFIPTFAKTLLVLCGFLKFRLVRSVLFLLVAKSAYYLYFI